MIPAPFSLRFATEADLPVIVEIYNSIIAGRMVTADLEPVTIEGRKPWFVAHNNQTRPIWVLTDTSTGNIVAWMSFDTFFARAAYDGTAMIAIYVAEARRGQGIGSILLAHAIEIAPTHGVNSILGYIFGHNVPSLRLFEKLGFSRWAHLPRIAELDGVERDLIIVGRHVGRRSV